MKVTFAAEDSVKRPLFEPRASDIIISPYAKSGTTWLQQIMHGLRTGGSMDFEEITAVVPWIDVAHDIGIDINAEQVAVPRLFKSHASWHEVPKGARYVVSFRHPFDVMVSLYRFLEGWTFEPGSINLAEFVRWRVPAQDAESSGYWRHLASWWAHRDSDNVLLLCYEDMKNDLPGTVRRLARFMDIELTDSLFETVLRQSSREFMLAHKAQFDDRFVRRLSEVRAGLPPAGDAHKVTAGSTAARYHLSEDTKAILDALWHKHIELPLGFASYDDLRQALGDRSSAS